MARLKSDNIQWESIPSVKQLMKELNIKRITYSAVIFIFFEILNLVNQPFHDLYFDGGVYTNIGAYHRIGTIILFAGNFLYLIITRVFYKKILQNNVLTKVTYLSYWSMIVIGMTPFLIRDIIVSSDGIIISALNITLLMTLFVIMPIFSRVELIVVYSAFLVYNMSMMIMYDAVMKYSLFVIGLCVSTFIIAYFVQYRYMNMIVKLNLEVRVDYLTGIMNRRGGIDKIQTVYELVKRQNSCMAVYMIDIDYFKQYNDKYGHPEGDAVLKKVAQAITKTFGRVSDVICRYGGEEFLVCSVVNEAGDAELLAEKIQENIKELKIEAAHKAACDLLTVSIGCCVYDMKSVNHKTTVTVDELIYLADKELYTAKNTGRNKVSTDIIPKQ
jgi:diguanylate cyclase (GGDEF) domain